MSWLYRYETKGIQSWILDSNMLRDLAGGSALVEQLTRTARQKAEALGGPGTIKQATSGSMTAVFDTKEALESFASVWPLELSLRAPGLQLVQAWVENAGTLRPLFERLAQARNTAPITENECGPWVLRAGKSGLPAVPSRKLIKARQTKQDATSLAKEDAYDTLRTSGSAVTGNRPWNAFNDSLEEWHDREGPVAVIHADGTGVGQRLIDMSLDQLESFSKALKDVTTEAVQKALEILPQRASLDARPVVSAGDDLTYIVPARHGRAFARAWLEALEKGSEQHPHLRGKIAGGAGVVVVHRKFPFAQAYEMAEKLCNAAKKKLKNRNETGVSVVAFRRVTTSWLPAITHHALGWRLTGGNDLDELAQAVNALPRGTMRNWLTYFEQNEARAEQLWKRAREVATPSVWEAFERALVAAGASPTTGELDTNSLAAINLDDHRNNRATPIRDALALRYFEKETES